jgi:hypothetical protein
MMRRLPCLLAAAASTLILGCKPSKAPQPPPAAQGKDAGPAATTVQGKVLEHLEAAPFSYLRLQTDQGEVWVGIPHADLKPGAMVKVVGAYPMSKFESKKAKRTFDLVYLGTLEGQTASAVDAAHGGAQAPAPAPASAPEGPSPHAGGLPAPAPATAGGMNPTAEAILQSMSGPAPKGSPAQAAAPGTPKPADVKIEKVPKAAGADARTVAELHAQKTALKEKTVSIRGKVVKFNAQIMGKNWLHLQDGSGDPKAGTHDITVTSADTVKVGDLVTIKGTVRLKKDFGAGYAYEVIVEDARVSH